MTDPPRHHRSLEEVEEEIDHLLGSEYEHVPVPTAAR
jgi:hypothetical protein